MESAIKGMTLLEKSSKIEGFDKTIVCEIPQSGIERLSRKFDLHSMPPEYALIRNGVITSVGNVIESKQGKHLRYSLLRHMKNNKYSTQGLEICKDGNNESLVALGLRNDYFEIINSSIWTAKKYYREWAEKTLFG